MIPESFRQLREDLEDRPVYRRAWNLCMLEDDAAAFSAALKAAVPRIRFISRHYWEQFVDQERWKRDCLEYNRRRKLGLPEFDLRRHMREPSGEPLRYWDSFAGPAERDYIGWVEPPGWQPLWAAPDNYGVRYIVNTPRLWFEFRRSSLMRGARHICYRSDAEPRPASAQETLLLEGTHFEVRWNPHELEAERFGKRIYNVLRKLTTWRFVDVESKSRKAFTGKPRGMLKQCLAGHHADAWTRKRRHNYLACTNSRGYLKSAEYPLRRRDAFTAAELRQWQANEEQDFQEKLRLHNEAYERFREYPERGDIEFESRGGKLVAARLYKSRETSSPPSSTAAASQASRVALELRVRRRRGRAEWH